MRLAGSVVVVDIKKLPASVLCGKRVTLTN